MSGTPSPRPNDRGDLTARPLDRAVLRALEEAKFRRRYPDLVVREFVNLGDLAGVWEQRLLEQDDVDLLLPVWETPTYPPAAAGFGSSAVGAGGRAVSRKRHPVNLITLLLIGTAVTAMIASFLWTGTVTPTTLACAASNAAMLPAVCKRYRSRPRRRGWLAVGCALLLPAFAGVTVLHLDGVSNATTLQVFAGALLTLAGSSDSLGGQKPPAKVG